MENKKELLHEALKVVNLQFDNNVFTLLNNKNKKIKVDVTNFKRELLKNNPQAVIFSSLNENQIYEEARKLILEMLRKEIPKLPPS
jgi:hypothetical protein